MTVELQKNEAPPRFAQRRREAFDRFMTSVQLALPVGSRAVQPLSSSRHRFVDGGCYLTGPIEGCSASEAISHEEIALRRRRAVGCAISAQATIEDRDEARTTEIAVPHNNNDAQR
jgi:hypothetical protein